MGGTSGDADGHAEAPNSALDEDAPQPHEVAWDAPPAGFRFEDGATSEDDDDDDGEVWEEVAAHQGGQSGETDIGASGAQEEAEPQTSHDAGPSSIEISAADMASARGRTTARRRGITAAQRSFRRLLHRTHLLTLTAASLLRNKWCNSELLKAVLISMLPQDLVTSAAVALHASLDETILPLVHRLAEWWFGTFHSPTLSNTRSKSGTLTAPASGAAEVAVTIGSADDVLSALQDAAARQVNAPETASAVGFTALCRALGLDARLVASMHPIPLSFAKATGVGSARSGISSIVFWCEVLGPKSLSWTPVTPCKGLVHSAQEPQAAADQRQLCYAIAWDAENTAKDVTARYSVAWSTTTRKLRLPPGERGEGWWKLVLWLYSKSVKTARERREDAALAMSQVNEPMPTKFAGFENHPLYTLERHCKKDQIIFPKDQKYVVGVFKKENVYPRSHVHTGRIPRNPFGNIEILHPRMIPSGAVHIPVKGVASVARKLGVDFAQALVRLYLTTGNAGRSCAQR
ncbi:hypothetical protein HK105_201682 [Polyrhizophydium stewartii]|uniref:Uncharacterized protein n=1 Tax=Polyrhizophydium stewartii TaxID=2732419 RepID=A0ABR4NH56_9FUNG